MKYGLDIPTVAAYADARVLADLAVEAEQAGWDGFFIQDVLTSSLPLADPWIALTAIAMQTQRLKLGIFLTPLPRRRPWQVAREAVTLDHLSNGRLIFGAALGFQAPDFVPFGEDYDPKIRAQKLDEALDILKGLWSGEPFSFRGEHYQINDVTFLPKPLQSPRIPIWVAGGWPNRKPFQRAARWDGVYVMTYNQATMTPLTAEELRDALKYLGTYRDNAEPFEIAVNGETPNDPVKGAEIVQPYLDAGATWWIEYEASRETFEAYRERIRHGPPRR